MLEFRAIAAAALLGLGAAGAGAVETSDFRVDDTADLAALCGVAADSPNAAAAIHMCHGYMLGVHHFNQAYAHTTEEDLYCVPTGEAAPTRDSFVAGFVGWVAANPSVGEMEALDGLLSYASAVFSCE